LFNIKKLGKGGIIKNPVIDVFNYSFMYIYYNLVKVEKFKQ